MTPKRREHRGLRGACRPGRSGHSTFPPNPQSMKGNILLFSCRAPRIPLCCEKRKCSPTCARLGRKTGVSLQQNWQVARTRGVEPGGSPMLAALVLVAATTAATAAAAPPAQPVTPRSHPEIPALGDKLDGWLVAADFRGSALVSKDGVVLLRKGYGKADRENNVAYDADTVFDVGSITKQFTAAMILKLEMQGKLRVEDPISKFFPEAPDDKKAITLHQLLDPHVRPRIRLRGRLRARVARRVRAEDLRLASCAASRGRSSTTRIPATACSVRSSRSSRERPMRRPCATTCSSPRE